MKKLLIVKKGTVVRKEVADSHVVCSPESLPEVLRREFGDTAVLLNAETYSVYPGPLGPRSEVKTVTVQ